MGTAEVGNDESDAALGLNSLVSRTTNSSQGGTASYVAPAPMLSAPVYNPYASNLALNTALRNSQLLGGY